MAVLVIADVHANLQALDAVLEDAGEVDAVWCLGDSVGYGAQPNEVLARLRAVGALCVAGNHEWAALERLDLRTFNPAAAEAARWTAEALSAASHAMLSELPERRVEDRCTLVHGSPRDPIWEYILAPWVARENFDFFDTRVCFFGHTHVPAAHGLVHPAMPESPTGRVHGDQAIELHPGDRYLLNPGSVGQPRDEDERAAYLLWDPDTRGCQWRRVDYDVEAAQALIRDAGLPDVLWQRLGVGR